MYIKNTYKFEKNGVIGLACGYKPEAGEILEELKILYAESDFELYKGEEKIGGCVILKDGEKQSDYTEKEVKKEQAEEEQ